jgi:hypothetical protein
VGEVEARVEAERHDRCCSARSANAGEQAKNTSVRVEAEVVVALGKGHDLVEVLALDPVLVLAGRVASVGALLKHVARESSLNAMVTEKSGE